MIYLEIPVQLCIIITTISERDGCAVILLAHPEYTVGMIPGRQIANNM